QGRGLGSSILRRELSYVVDTSPFPASLVTQKPQNVTFYEKLGFQVTNDEPIAINGRSFPNWIMVRQKPR
ncbi:GNAT family N-acetyltransferase, partial [Komagataeibacter sucrofermentans]